MSLKHLARHLFLYALLLGAYASNRAQEIKPQGVPAPPPPRAVEYNPNSWLEFSSAEGRFKVDMPGIPYLTTQVTPTDVGTVTLHNCQLNTPAAMYIVTYADFPIKIEDPDVLKKYFDAIRDALLANHKGDKLLGENEITLNKEVGREWLMDDGNFIIRHRNFFIKYRLYQIILGIARSEALKAGRSGTDPQDRTEFYEMVSSKFHNSFKLLDDASAKGSEALSWLKTSKGDALVIGPCTGPQCRSVTGELKRGELVSKPEPEYPAIALVARASGEVKVQVTIDEEGKVIDASAVSGHPLLRAAAVKAAHAAVFAPTLLDGKAVKVMGVIDYNFAPR
jgi:TonB family protein